MIRRDFIKLIGALGAAALNTFGVQRGSEKLISYLVPEEENMYRGVPVYKNSTCQQCYRGCASSVKLYLKNNNDKTLGLFPIKIEGNKNSPINKGKLCGQGQAGVPEHYNPQRIKYPLIKNNDKFEKISFEKAFKIIDEKLKNPNNAFISSYNNSLFKKLYNDFYNIYDIKTFNPEFSSYSNIIQANNFLFNQKKLFYYDFEKCDFLLTINASVFDNFLNPVQNANIFKNKHGKFSHLHLYSSMNLTSITSDFNFFIKPENEIYLLMFIYDNLIQARFNISKKEVSRKTGIEENIINTIIEKLKTSKTPLIITNPLTETPQSINSCILTNIILYKLKAFNKAISTDKYYNVPDTSFTQTVNQLSNNKINNLIISKINLYDLLPEQIADNILKNSKFKICFSFNMNKTSSACGLILPLSDEFESYNLNSFINNIITYSPPVCNKLYNSLSEEEIIFHLLKLNNKNKSFISFKKYIDNYLNKNFNKMQRNILKEKGILENKTKTNNISLSENKTNKFLKNINPSAKNAELYLIFSNHFKYINYKSSEYSLIDEIPETISSISYGKFALIPEAIAEKNNIKNNDLINLSNDKISINIGVKVIKHNINTITIYQSAIHNLKVNKPDDLDFIYTDIKIKKISNNAQLAILGTSIDEKNRNIIQTNFNKQKLKEKRIKHFYKPHKYKDYLWAMAIDLNKCIGCSSCVAACYIENNIPIVGKNQHLLQREMSWIRIESYYKNNKYNFIPVMCQQCEYAPCESVCPVYATYHNPQGLNAQIYNRCVGTRYCSNNCPYKARRFNWIEHKLEKPLEKMLNPEVYKRPKGVMEKCSFCVQRIRAGLDKAKDENRKAKDTEIIPACAQTCPTGAIIFGNILDKNSLIYRTIHKKTNYKLLENLSTEPKVYYIKKNEYTI